MRDRAREVALHAVETMALDGDASSVMAGAVAHVVSRDDAADRAFDTFLTPGAGEDPDDEDFADVLARLLGEDPLALTLITRAADAARHRAVAPPPPMPPPPAVPRFTEGLELPRMPGPGPGTGPTADEPNGYQAYPHLRPAAQLPTEEFLLHPRVPFELEVGLSEFPDHSDLVVTPDGLEAADGMTVTVHLSYDPESFRIEGELPVTLPLTADEPFPVRTVSVTPLPTRRPLSDRRIAAHYLVDGTVRAIAFLALRDAGAARSPRPAPAALVDLTALTDEQPPDVVLAVYGADAAAPGSYTIAAFPRDRQIAPPEVGRIDLGPEAADFMTDMFRAGNRGGDPSGVYDTLTGIGWRIGTKIPAGIFTTLKAIAEAASADSPATMLLLTEESAVPWELAAFGRDRDIDSPAGDGSPFLGAHFAIGRWPLVASTTTPRVPDPRRVDVRQAALVRADYDGVGDGWLPLPGAVAEVERLAASYTPSAVWSPLIDEVKENLSSDVDVIHFALHGQVDTSPGETGLVLLRRDGEKLRPAYLSSDEILGLLTRDRAPLPTSPFIFLNACQVGQGQQLLGDYAGMAAALLEAGARAVVACIWNVNDGVAGSISTEFYERADRGEAPAEILRSVRTRYAPPSDADGDTPPAPTLIAYQYFGHPGMRVVRTG